MTIEEIIKEAFSQGWNASHECATDFDYEYSLKNCLYQLNSEIKKLNLPAVVGRSEQLVCECLFDTASFQLDNGDILCCKCERPKAN